MLAVVYAVGAIMLCQNSDILKKINNNNNNNINNNLITLNLHKIFELVVQIQQ